MRRKRFKRVIGAAAAAFMAVFICFTHTMDASAAENTGSVTESDGISAYIVTDKAEYEAGETISFTIVVENNKLHSYTSKTKLTYTNTPGLVETSEGSIPAELAKLEYGSKAELSGTLVGDASVFPPSENKSGVNDGGNGNGSNDSHSRSNSAIIIAVIAAAGAVAAYYILKARRKKEKQSTTYNSSENKDGKAGTEKTADEKTKTAEAGKGGNTAAKVLALILTGSLLASLIGTPVKVQADDFETITLRPYINVIYGGQEVLIRAIMELHAYQERVIIPKEHKVSIKGFTCHDPSVFKDKDGTYYILGTHITGGTSKDLINWVGMDTALRGRFSTQTIARIREWNKDEKSGSWNGYLWAPDVVYNPVLDKYCYYLSANGDDWKSNIVMLTADAPDGPYEYAGSVVYGGFTQSDLAETDLPKVLGTDELPERYIKNGIANKKWGDKWPNCIDPCVFYDDDGNLWMTYGSWSGGIFMLALDENTGLSDYNVSYETNEHSDAYFGKKIAGGWYVSGEGSYIQKIGDWYWLFMSYGNLEAKGGYNIRVFRSKTPDGDYVDELGNSALYDKYIFNYNQSVGVRMFGGYKWRTFAQGQVAQGHNSAFVNDDGRAYIVYHSRTTDGSEGHTVKIHQLFLNKEGWLVAAPYYFAEEKLPDKVDMAAFAGVYEVIVHQLNIDYKNLDTNKPEYITLNADGTITGAYEGSWNIEDNSPYITLSFNGDTYSGVALKQCVENTDLETDVFTALGRNTQITVWGSKTLVLE
ncbi:MAG: glycoside hydrolase family 43 protein [Lachnospiraceae bacterium]|nr:glycoside hydrolase family 43 protein [Lachnospiraceae bacterium]